MDTVYCLDTLVFGLGIATGVGASLFGGITGLLIGYLVRRSRGHTPKEQSYLVGWRGTLTGSRDKRD